MNRKPLVSVIGAGAPSEKAARDAYEVGRILASRGWGVVTGGLGGVMASACQGAQEAGGLTVGILPGREPDDANPYCQVVIPTGLGQARNVMVVLAGRGAIAVSGGAGTLSEIGHALKSGRPVVSLGSWQVADLPQACSPQEAVDLLLGRLEG